MTTASYQDDVGAAAAAADWDGLAGRSFLVTGATGAVGRALIDVIMERNRISGDAIRVTAVGRSAEKGRAVFGRYLGDPCFDFLEHDVRDRFPASGSPDYIIHGASNTHPVAYATDPVGTIMVNVLGTANLLERIAADAHGRLVLLSTVDIYGESRDASPFREDGCGCIDPNTLRAGYPESKRVSEALCQAYRADRGVDHVTVRLSRVYGPTMGDDDSKAMAQFIRDALAGRDIALKSDGMQEFSYIYVMDAVTAILMAAARGEGGGAYNAGGPGVRLRDVVATLCGIAGTDARTAEPDEAESRGASPVRSAVLDSSKLMRLGWSPATDLETGLRRTLAILGGGASAGR